MRIYTSTYDPDTGEITSTERDMTPEEEAQWAADQAAAEAAPSVPTAEQIRAALKATGKTDAQIDALFALAAATL